ncbi:hypothetical protein TNCV_4979071 [Trichonephila clavipes]|nr:hypothetical protein TNCV_4979071 [Trichonephila clavipes]
MFAASGVLFCNRRAGSTNASTDRTQWKRKRIVHCPAVHRFPSSAKYTSFGIGIRVISGISKIVRFHNGFGN